MARPKGSSSLASRLMAGRLNPAGIYAEDSSGKQVYLHCEFKNRGPDKPRLQVRYVGSGVPGRSQTVVHGRNNPEHQAWLLQHWVGRTLLAAKPQRLERLDWLEERLVEYSCAEGLVIFETPLLAHALRVESRLIELYGQQKALFNSKLSHERRREFRAVPNHGSLREHVPVIRERIAAGDAIKAIARDYGVDPSSIRCIRNGRSYKDVA